MDSENADLYVMSIYQAVCEEKMVELKYEFGDQMTRDQHPQGELKPLAMIHMFHHFWHLRWIFNTKFFVNFGLLYQELTVVPDIVQYKWVWIENWIWTGQGKMFSPGSKVSFPFYHGNFLSLRELVINFQQWDQDQLLIYKL